MFTSHQQAVIDADTGHLIVSAVAGSGKTSTLIGRIIRLIKSGVPPTRILILIFGKTVSLDFITRLKVAGAQHGTMSPPVLTFHAFGTKLISAMVERNDLPHARLITKESEVAQLVRSTIDSFKDNPEWKFKSESSPDFLRDFASMIEFIKSTSTAVDVEKQLKNPEPDSILTRFKPMLLEGFLKFETLRKQAKVRTFSDLIFDPVTAIRENPNIANYVANRYDHILVDEFQDINSPQWDMLVAVAGSRAKITVVGDEDQAIFAWRGASSKFTSKMKNTYQDVQEFVLPHTFRFGHRVALAANHVISHNTDRMNKLCISADTTRDTRMSVLMSDYDSGQSAAKTVQDWLADGKLVVDIAVLVREYSHSLAVESAFLQNNIPYCIVGAEPFFNRPEVLTLRGCLQLAAGGLRGMDSHKLRMVVNAMLRVPTVYLKNEQIEHLSSQIISDPGNFMRICRNYEQSLSAESKQSYKLKNFRASIDAWESCLNMPGGISASTFLENIVRKLGLYEYFNRSSVTEGTSERERMVRGLITSAQLGDHTVESFTNLLDDLVSRYDSIRHDDCVLITSIHRAKGMEWPCVILPELSESNFPGSTKKEKLSDDIVSNERNLFYVGITRAIDHLVMICPKDPLLKKWSNEDLQIPPPLDSIVASRFLYEGNFAACSSVGKSIYNCTIPTKSSDVICKYITSSQNHSTNKMTP